jgi:hypothetical protein
MPLLWAVIAVSRFHGVHLAAAAKPLRTQNLAVAVSKISATAVVNTGRRETISAKP